MDLASAYVDLGLAFDHLEPGFVDAFTGDPVRRTTVAEAAPAELAARARALLTELPSSGLSGPRADWLEGQLVGLEASGRVLAGERVGFVEQVQAYFQVRPSLQDHAVYAAAHAELDGLLPGDGALPARREEHLRRTAVPPERLDQVVQEVSGLLRDRSRSAYPLAPHEQVAYDVVTDQPWAGFNYYLGNSRSTVAINADLPISLGALPGLVAHESYPGHHTERCRKEVTLDGLPEHGIFLVNTPECLLAEGLADLGLAGLGLDTGWGRLAEQLYADLGLSYDGERGEAIARAGEPLGAVQQDAALMLHDLGRSQDEVQAHLERWGLLSPERARKTLEFLTHPLWRAYICTYVEGERLLRTWLAARPPGQPVADRFGRLLDEPITPRALQVELAG